MPVQSENKIIARVKAGHTSDFEYLVRCYQRSLFRIVGNLVHASIVEDVVQDIFLTAYARIQDFDPRRAPFSAWIYQIARNRALNARKKKRELLPGEEMEVADERTPSHDLLVKEAYSRLDQALSELKFSDRVIFVLAELEGLSYAEIAHIEKLALGTVKSRLARVKIKLRNALQPYVN
jgi:RNA polymerase sigma-70 factor (ECF subfamily)